MKMLVALSDYIYASKLKIVSYFKSLDYGQQIDANRTTVIIIPGVYETPYFFTAIHDELSPTFNIIYAYDMIKNARNIDEGAKIIAHYIHDNGYNDVILLGHSSGGLTAVRSLMYSVRVARVIAIASPFHGVINGHLLRTNKVKELLPQSSTIHYFKKLPISSLDKIISVYPTYDNQIWSKKGSYLNGAENIQLKSNGHHLVLKSDELCNLLTEILK